MTTNGLTPTASGPVPTLGPYERDSDARRDAKALIEQYGVPADQADWRWAKEALLAMTVHRTGVQFGEFDLSTMEMIAGICSVEQCQAIVGWINRAGVYAWPPAAGPFIAGDDVITRCDECRHTFYTCNATGCAGRRELGWRGWPPAAAAGAMQAERLPWQQHRVAGMPTRRGWTPSQLAAQLAADAEAGYLPPDNRPPEIVAETMLNPGAGGYLRSVEIDSDGPFRVPEATEILGEQEYPACQHRPGVRLYTTPCEACDAIQERIDEWQTGRIVGEFRTTPEEFAKLPGAGSQENLPRTGEQ